MMISMQATGILDNQANADEFLCSPLFHMYSMFVMGDKDSPIWVKNRHFQPWT
jgi:hypothetical protein